ncbi:MAG: hypothetical protein PVG24_10435 [Gammaproteobacteria bacterium]|jgi:hypothetical protein
MAPAERQSHCKPAVERKATESDRVERAGNDVAEPAHPAGQKTVRATEAFLDPDIAAAGARECCAELCIGERRQQRDEAIEEEDEHDGRSRGAGRNAAQGEDAGAYHSADAHHGDRKQAEVPTQPDLGVLFAFCVGLICHWLRYRRCVSASLYKLVRRR